MKYLCLAYGHPDDWNDVPPDQQRALLEQDDRIREQGNVVAAVQATPVTLRIEGGEPRAANGPACDLPAPLAGFYIVEAESVEDVVAMLEKTPCPQSGGAIEIRPIA